MIMQIASAFAYLAVFAIAGSGFDIPGGDWLIFTALSFAVVGNYIAFYKSLEIGPVAIVTPVVAAYAAVVVILAVLLLDEKLSLTQTLGAVLAIGGVILASADFRAMSERKPRVGKGVALGIVSLFGFGITSFIAGYYARRYDWLIPAVPVRLITTVMFLALASTRGTLTMSSVGWRLGAFTALIGIVEASGFLFFTKGSELGFLAIAAAASASYPLIPLVLGITVFKERLAPNQWVGVAAVLIGVLALAL